MYISVIGFRWKCTNLEEITQDGVKDIWKISGIVSIKYFQSILFNYFWIVFESICSTDFPKMFHFGRHFRKLKFIPGLVVLEVEKTRIDNGYFTGLSYKIGHKYDRKIPSHVLRGTTLEPVLLFSQLCFFSLFPSSSRFSTSKQICLLRFVFLFFFLHAHARYRKYPIIFYTHARLTL